MGWGMEASNNTLWSINLVLSQVLELWSRYQALIGSTLHSVLKFFWLKTKINFLKIRSFIVNVSRSWDSLFLEYFCRLLNMQLNILQYCFTQFKKKSPLNSTEIIAIIFTILITEFLEVVSLKDSLLLALKAVTQLHCTYLKTQL